MKPIKAKTHGIIDYVFAGIQIAVPALLKSNRKARGTYQALGAAFLASNTLTDTPVALKRLIPMREHQKADAFFLSGLALLTASKMIRSDKRALAFHLIFLSAAICNYVLSDYTNKAVD